MSKTNKPVQPKGKKDKHYVGTITIEQQLVMRRAARRQSAIDNGMATKSGAGYHDSNMRKRNRQERREAKLASKYVGDDHE